MKICPTCQTTYADDSNIFCLNDGATLVDPQNLRQPQQSRPKSSLPLVLALLGGFLIFAIIVGAVGLYLFSIRNGGGGEKPKANANKTETPANQNNTASNSDQSLPSVQIETNRTANVKLQTSPVQNSPPQIIASSSSVRKPMKGNLYFPNFAFDDNPSTAWCEGASGTGIGEWINFEFDRAVKLRQIKIQPGYFKNAQVWRDNNRVREALLEFSDGTSKTASFSDQMQTQTVDVGLKQTRWVRITIEDVFNGAHDSEDTLISEVSFVTEP
jgi:hypothetical protein